MEMRGWRRIMVACTASYHYDPNETLETILAEFTRQCAEVADRLHSLPAEAWSCPGTHPSYGTHTLQWWAERMLAHIEEHLVQVSRRPGLSKE